MLDKKVTRKQFLAGLLSVGAVVALSKIPSVLKKPKASTVSSYGNSAYGGDKKHA